MEQLTEIGSYDAKTHLPELLRSVLNGKKFMITLRGKPVAELVPAGTSAGQDSGNAAAEMEHFIKKHPPVKSVDLKALIDEGRD